MKKTLFLLLMLLPVFITSCNEDDDLSSAKNERKDIVLTRSQKEMVNENVKFAFSLFNKVNELETERPNWIISPLSASIALSMTANGTAENSQTQIQNSLGFNGFPIDEINNYYNLLTEEFLSVDNTSKLSIANSIWLHSGFPVYDSFVKTEKEMYDAEVTTLDLSNNSALRAINDWSARKTNYLIPEILKQLPMNVKFFILNSLYFKGVWKNRFYTSSTNDFFTCANGKLNKITMMKQSGKHQYDSNESFALAAFPYGNEAFSMIVLLPNENCTLNESLQKFTADYWMKFMNMSSTKLDVSFPRFELKYETDLTEVMKSLGITDIFDENKADFSNMTPEEIFVGLLKQSVYIKVDEKGSEVAATTTGVELVGGSAKDEYVDFHMNRPFAFLIMENSTGTILFMGKVTEL